MLSPWTRGSRVRVLVCALILVLNLLSPLHVSSISSTHALEESEYSVTSLLPSIKTFFFWRTDKTTEEKMPITENVVYKVTDDTEDSTTDYRPTPVESAAHNRQRPSFFNKDNRICHSCAKNSIFLTEDEEIRQRIELIKEQILTRLGMKKPPQPKPDIDLSLYMRLAENTISQRELNDLGPTRTAEQETPEETDKAFILPSTTTTSKMPTFNLSSVNISDPSKVIKSIFILVNYNLTEYYYRTLLHDTDLIITSDSAEDNDISRNFYFRSTVSPMTPSEGNEPTYDSVRWYQYDVTTLLSDHSGRTIQIHNEDFDILSSVILVEIANKKLTRAKRSIDCTDNGSFCCRQHFYVNFTTIGWNNWIFQPPGYNANYCKGKCDLSHARYHHTTVIGKYPAIKLCCSPREMSSISLIYMDDKFNIYQKNLPNMVVESCDCA